MWVIKQKHDIVVIRAHELLFYTGFNVHLINSHCACMHVLYLLILILMGWLAFWFIITYRAVVCMWSICILYVYKAGMTSTLHTRVY